MELREYQTDIANLVLSNTKSKDMIQLATGGGKTVIAGFLCKHYLSKNKKVIYVAHREELILQPKKKLYSQFGIESSIIKASEKSDLTNPMQIASVQTFYKRLNFDPDVIIIDEAHHSKASTYQMVINNYPNAKLIGLTATPYRLSGKGFKDTFNRLVSSKSIKELENMGFLVPAKCYSYPIGHDKLSRIKITGGDYNESQLEKVMIDRVLIEDIIVSYEKHAKGKKMIVFASSVKHSQAICQRFKEYGFNALHIDSKSKNRSEIIKSFRLGDTDILCNVGIATEGVDIPEIEAVCLARPTKSLALYLQMCGRGSRPFKNKKKYLLLDHSDNYYEHGAPNYDFEWDVYFNGIENYREEIIQGSKFSIQINDNNDILEIGNILDLPAKVKGFALKEISFKKKEYKSIEVRFCKFCGEELGKRKIIDFCNDCNSRYNAIKNKSIKLNNIYLTDDEIFDKIKKIDFIKKCKRIDYINSERYQKYKDIFLEDNQLVAKDLRNKRGKYSKWAYKFDYMCYPILIQLGEEKGQKIFDLDTNILYNIYHIIKNNVFYSFKKFRHEIKDEGITEILKLISCDNG